MPVELNDLLIRMNHRVRFKVRYLQTPTQPFVERDAILVRVDEPHRLAYFTIGVVTLPYSWDDIETIEGGVGPPRDTSGSQGSGF